MGDGLGRLLLGDRHFTHRKAGRAHQRQVAHYIRRNVKFTAELGCLRKRLVCLANLPAGKGETSCDQPLIREELRVADCERQVMRLGQGVVGQTVLTQVDRQLRQALQVRAQVPCSLRLPVNLHRLLRVQARCGIQTQRLVDNSQIAKHQALPVASAVSAEDLQRLFLIGALFGVVRRRDRQHVQCAALTVGIADFSVEVEGSALKLRRLRQVARAAGNPAKAAQTLRLPREVSQLTIQRQRLVIILFGVGVVGNVNVCRAQRFQAVGFKLAVARCL